MSTSSTEKELLVRICVTFPYTQKGPCSTEAKQHLMPHVQALLRQRDADLEERGRLLLKTKVPARM